MTTLGTIAVLAFLSGISAAVAQETMHSIECSFDRVCSWAEGCRDQNMEFGFAFDPGTGFGLMSGNVGASLVEVSFGQDLLGTQIVSFVERLPSGVIQSTTLTERGNAVHSRHTVIAGEIVPTQNYGTCELEAWW